MDLNPAFHLQKTTLQSWGPLPEEVCGRLTFKIWMLCDNLSSSLLFLYFDFFESSIVLVPFELWVCFCFFVCFYFSPSINFSFKRKLAVIIPSYSFGYLSELLQPTISQIAPKLTDIFKSIGNIRSVLVLNMMIVKKVFCGLL